VFVIIPSIILISVSFKSLDETELGIDYNSISLSLEQTFSDSGLYFLGLGHWFITYPRTIQTIEFTALDLSRLHTRTNDGLPITLSVSFQYRYNADQLMENYLSYKHQEVEVYEYVAVAVIANVATNYSAYDFFYDKRGIAIMMQNELALVFDDMLFARIDALQITEVQLPASFQSAILTSIATKQNITTSRRYLDNMVVTFETQKLVAENIKNQTVIAAQGLAQKRNEEAMATAAMIRQSVTAQMYSYGNLTQIVGLSPEDALSYIWWDQQNLESNGASRSKDFVVGINPNMYVRQQAS